VVNYYATAECDYQTQQSNFYFNFPSNDGKRIKLFKQWQPNKNIHTLAMDDSNPTTAFK